MAQTSNGTTYTPRTFTTPDGNPAHWYMDDERTGDESVPVLIYTHGRNGNYDQFYALSPWRGLRNWLMDNGWAVVEGVGGDPDGWGNQAQRDGYMDAFHHVDAQINVGDIYVLGRSMGGLVGYWLTVLSPIAHRVRGLIANSGTTDLAYRGTHNNPSGVPHLLAAYDAATVEEFYDNIVGYDPMQFDTHLWEEKRVLQMWGTADNAVAAAQHAIPWFEKYSDHTLEATVDIREGGDHSQTNGSYLQTEAMVSFLTPRVKPQDEMPPMRVVGTYYLDTNGTLYQAL